MRFSCVHAGKECHLDMACGTHGGDPALGHRRPLCRYLEETRVSGGLGPPAEAGPEGG